MHAAYAAAIRRACIDGIYYNPASKRYKQNTVPVWCDRCNKEPLQACISAAGVDICLPCAEALNLSEARKLKKNKPPMYLKK